MSCSKLCCAKTVLTILNVLGLIGSIYLIVIGVISIGRAPPLLVSLYFISGGSCLIAAILGLFGVLRENMCLTTAYAVFVVIFLIEEIVGTIFSSQIGSMRIYATDIITKLWEKEINEPNSMDYVQETYKCCGKNTPNDYVILGRDYPSSCYGKDRRTGEPMLYHDGCIAKAEVVFEQTVHSILAGSWGGVVFTVIILAFTGYVLMRFRLKTRRYDY